MEKQKKKKEKIPAAKILTSIGDRRELVVSFEQDEECRRIENM